MTLSVGEHVRLPRTYRGRDVLWWMDASGVWNQRYDEIDDLTRARRLPSPQLVGTPERDDARSQRAQRDRRRARRPPGRRARRPRAVLGRAAQSVRAGRPQDGAAARHLRRVGARARRATRRRPRRSASSRRACRRRRGSARSARAARSARSSGRPAFVPTTAGSTCRSSTRRATCGTTAASSTRPGLYAIGLPVLRRRKSTFIHGAEDDAREVDRSPRRLTLSRGITITSGLSPMGTIAGTISAGRSRPPLPLEHRPAVRNRVDELGRGRGAGGQSMAYPSRSTPPDYGATLRLNGSRNPCSTSRYV